MASIQEETPFTFPLIDHGFDEVRYLRAQELIRQSAQLLGDGAGLELGLNGEYERGQAELICEACGIPGELKEQVIEQIHDTAQAYVPA